MNETAVASKVSNKVVYPKWQFISQGEFVAAHVFFIQLALDVGCKWVQLRLKEAEENEIIQAGLAVSRLCVRNKAIFILNDYVKLVKSVGSGGVHLGVKDQHICEARRFLGPDYIIGGTVNTQADLSTRIKEQADYIGMGPFRFTRTKKVLSPVLGIEGYKRLLGEKGSKRRVSCPVYAIGGIGTDDLSELQLANIDGVAFSGYLTAQVNLAAWEKQQHVPLSLDNCMDYYRIWKANHPVIFDRISVQIQKIEALLDKRY